MSSLSALLGVMGESLMAQQEGLDVAGQNVANVNTPGYVRRSALLESQAVLPGSDGGVDIAGVQRAFNAFTYGQVNEEHGVKGAADERSTALGQAQATLAPDGGGGIADQMSAFFSSLDALAASPSDPSARAAVLAQATQLAQSISSTANGLAQQQQSMLTRAQGIAGEVNSDVSQIAKLNATIAQAQAEGDNAPDLRDKRDSLITEVADRVGAKVVTDPSGSVTLFAGGTVLLTGTQASTLGVSVDSTGALKFTATRPGGAVDDITTGVTQGSLGGLREARDTDMAQSASQLDQLAYDLASSVNAVHQKGYGLDGATGRPLFAPPSQVKGAAAGLALDPSMVGHPERLAAATSAQDLPGGNDNAVALAQIATNPLGAGGPPAQRFAAIAAQLGSAKSAADTEAATRADTLTQAENLNSSSSGVSLSEEMANLTRFQQAFQASTQVLQITNGLMQTVLHITSPNG